MADTLGPQVPPAPGRLWASDKRRQDRQIRQLQQQRVQIPPASSGGGGPVGIVDLTSTAGSVIPEASGTEVDWGMVTYDEPTTRAGDGSWLSVSGPFLSVTRTGWYQPVLQVAIGWVEADAPGLVQVYTGGGGDIAHQSSEWLPLVTVGANRGVYRWVDRGPTYLSAGDEWWAEIGFTPATSAAFVTWVAGVASLNWTITKLS